METGQVRTILLRHATAWQHGGRAGVPFAEPHSFIIQVGAMRAPVPVPVPDPNGLAPVGDLLAILANRSPAEQASVAQDYVALWARTFRTLVRHLRGRPERAVVLLADEVYPYLRGRRAPVPTRREGRHSATLDLGGDLPAAYAGALVQSFVALSGARTTASADAAGLTSVAWRTPPGDRLARLSQHSADLRLPLLAAALLSTLVGIQLAVATGAFDMWRAVLVLAGVFGVQVGLTGAHDLLAARPRGPLGPAHATRFGLLVRTVAGYGVAATCGLILLAERPGVLIFGALGLALSLLYGKWRDEGLGPAVAGLAYGPVVALGAMYALAGADSILPMGPIWLTSLPLGFFAAAVLFMDDVADRPIDEAGGNRTLAVRLPRSTHLAVYVGLVAAGLTCLFLAALAWASPLAVVAVVAALPASWLISQVHAHLDDPHALGPARLGTTILLVVTGVTLLAMLRVPA